MLYGLHAEDVSVSGCRITRHSEAQTTTCGYFVLKPVPISWGDFPGYILKLGFGHICTMQLSQIKPILFGEFAPWKLLL